jgi:hypothetical protein
MKIRPPTADRRPPKTIFVLDVDTHWGGMVAPQKIALCQESKMHFGLLVFIIGGVPKAMKTPDLSRNH